MAAIFYNSLAASLCCFAAGLVEYRKHVGPVLTNIEAYNSNSNSSKLYFCVQLLFVETNTGSEFVALYRFKNYTEDRSTHNGLTRQ